MVNTNPMTGDVMDLVYTDKKGPSAHVMIYLGSSGPLKDANGQPYSDQYMEAYSYMPDNVELGKVRYNTLSKLYDSFNRFGWTIDSIEYFRRNQFQK